MEPRSRTFLQAALNGARPPVEHPAIPVSPAELAADARRVVRAGAAALHVHVRNGDGCETLQPQDVHAVLSAVRAACPGVPCGISTGAWIVPDPDERLALVAAWSTLPDYVSVNFDETGAAQIAALLRARGVAIEAGLNGPAATDVFLATDHPHDALRVLLEPGEPALADALATVAELESMLDYAAIARPRLLHGIGETAWPLLRHARERSYATRIGFEDTLSLPDGTRAASNEALVRAARVLLDASPASSTVLDGE
jgi:uncharacterized protein (DUF849 family)